MKAKVFTVPHGPPLSLNADQLTGILTLNATTFDFVSFLVLSLGGNPAANQDTCPGKLSRRSASNKSRPTPTGRKNQMNGKTLMLIRTTIVSVSVAAVPAFGIPAQAALQPASAHATRGAALVTRRSRSQALTPATTSARKPHREAS